MSDNPAVTQSGTVTPGHAMVWGTTGVAVDGGTPSDPALTSVGVLKSSGAAFAVSTALNPNPYEYFGWGFDPTTGNAQITLQNFNGAPVQALQFSINGTVYPFPGPGNGDVVGPLSATNGNMAVFSGPSGTIIADSGVPIYSVKFYGAKGDGTTDDTVAIQAAITACVAAGGGTVFFPSGTYKITGTLAATSVVVFEGQGQFISTLLFANGSADCITFIGATFAAPIEGAQVRYMSITGSSKTGGRAIFFQNCAYSFALSVFFSNAWNGIEVLSCNTLTFKDLLMAGLVSGSGGWGIYFHGSSDGSAGSFGLSLTNVTINALYSGAEGLIMDGDANTLNGWNSYCLGCSIGWDFRNTAVSNAFYPTFIELHNCGTDGISGISCKIGAGAAYNLVGCEFSNTSASTGPQGGADTNAIVILPDAAGSVTHGISIIGGRAGLSKETAIVTGGRDVLIQGVRVVAGETTPANTYAAIQITADAGDTTVVGVKNSEFGNPNNWSYGLQMDSGSTNTLADGNNFNTGSMSGSYLNNSGDPNTFVNNFIGAPSGSAGAVNQLPVAASPPATPKAGEQYYDSGLVTARYWNGSAWVNY